MKFKLSVIFIALSLILLVIFMWLKYVVDEDHIQPIVADMLGTEYQVEMQSARILPFQRGLSVGQLSIHSTSDEHLHLEIDTLSVLGIGVLAYIRNRISISSLRLNNFTLINRDDFPAANNDDSEDTRAIQELTIKNIDLTDGTILTANNQQITNFNLKGGFNTVLTSDPHSRDTGITIDSVGFLFSEDRYRLAISGVTYDENNGYFNVSAFKLNPVGGYDQFMNSLTYEANMLDISSTGITVTGIDPDAYRNESILRATKIDFESLHLSVSKNKQVPEDPEKVNPVLPNTNIAELPFAIQIDSLHFRNTDIQYSQQDEDGARPGTISFMNSTIRISDVNSSSSEPARLEAAIYLQNHAELNTVLNFTLNEGPFHMTGSGSLHSFDAPQLNSIFKDLEGLEIISGSLHELEFDFEMADDTSSGNMHLIYEDLAIKSLDREDYSESAGNYISSFLLNDLALRPDNMADSDDEVRKGNISHQRNPEDSFFRYLWLTLRSGIYEIILRV